MAKGSRHDETKGNGHKPEKSRKAGKEPRSADDLMFHNFMNKRDLAISWIRDYLPELNATAELDKLQIEPNEFHDANLSRWTADAVYSVPLRNARNSLKLALILEHKSRLKESERRMAIAQTMTYLCRQCLLEAKETSTEIVVPQPLAAIVYTGDNRNLTKISWKDSFPLPPQLERMGIAYELEVVNMSNLLAQGKKPKSEWLEIMYDVMTRTAAKELDGFEHSAFLPLLRHTGDWTETDSQRAAALTRLFSAHIQKARLLDHDERIVTLLESVNLEEKMGTEALYRMFAPAAKQFGIAEGIGIGRKDGIEIGRKDGIEIGRKDGIAIGRKDGIEIGRKEGIQEERDATLKEQRQVLCSAVRERFGVCPNAVRDAVKSVDDLNELFNIRLFAVTEAKSTDDILERTKAVSR